MNEITLTANAYTQSDILTLLKSNTAKRLAFLDLDSTMTGKTDVTNNVRQLLEKMGYGIVFVTTRTEEMLMSQRTYTATVEKTSFRRPRPNLKRIRDTYNYVPPETYEPKGLLDPEIIVGSTGSQILLRHKNYYVLDTTYDKQFTIESNEWRNRTIELLHHIDTSLHLSYIDRPDMYTNGTVDVAPPKYRVGLDFTSASEKKVFLKKLRLILAEKTLSDTLIEHAGKIAFINDSYPAYANYRLYLVPKNVNKAHAVEYLVQRLCETLHIKRSELEILIAGDSLPDLDMGISGGLGTKATFLLVGGSRLSKILLSGTQHEFGGEDLSGIKANLRQIAPGHFLYDTEQGKRNIIIGDIMFKAKTEVESLQAYIEQLHAAQS